MRRANEILKAASAFLRAGARPAPFEELMVFIDEHRDRFGVEPICCALQIAPSRYWARKQRQRRRACRTLSDDRLLVEIRRVHAQSRGLYGARKVFWQLKREGIPVARCTVERLMHREGLEGVVRGTRRRTTIPNEQAERPRDLVDRDFTASAPNVLGWRTSPT